MSNRKIKKLSLKSETLRSLSGAELDAVGGKIGEHITMPQSCFNCPSQRFLDCDGNSNMVGACTPQGSQKIHCAQSVMVCNAGQK